MTLFFHLFLENVWTCSVKIFVHPFFYSADYGSQCNLVQLGNPFVYWCKLHWLCRPSSAVCCRSKLPWLPCHYCPSKCLNVCYILFTVSWLHIFMVKILNIDIWTPCWTESISDQFKSKTPAISDYNSYFTWALQVGYDKQGLPIGLQFIGRPWGEASILRLASMVEVKRTGSEISGIVTSDICFPANPISLYYILIGNETYSQAMLSCPGTLLF